MNVECDEKSIWNPVIPIEIGHQPCLPAFLDGFHGCGRQALLTSGEMWTRQGTPSSQPAQARSERGRYREE